MRSASTTVSGQRQGAFESILRTWANTSMTELCDHIERTHHAYLKYELPQLGTALQMLNAELGGRYPQLAQVSQLFQQLSSGLRRHMQEEEVVYFPLCRKLDEGPTTLAQRRISEHLEAEFAEHDVAQDLMQQIRQLTDHYAAPSVGGGMLVACYHRLRRLEVDLANHVHKENAILYRIASHAERVAGAR